MATYAKCPLIQVRKAQKCAHDNSSLFYFNHFYFNRKFKAAFCNNKIQWKIHNERVQYSIIICTVFPTLSKWKLKTISRKLPQIFRGPNERLAYSL